MSEQKLEPCLLCGGEIVIYRADLRVRSVHSGPTEDPAYNWLCKCCNLSNCFPFTGKDGMENAKADASRRPTPAPRASTGLKPVAWEYRWFDQNHNKWEEWERVEQRGSETAESRLADLQAYIRDGYKYELRALYLASEVDALLAAPGAVQPSTTRLMEAEVEALSFSDRWNITRDYHEAKQPLKILASCVRRLSASTAGAEITAKDLNDLTVMWGVEIQKPFPTERNRKERLEKWANERGLKIPGINTPSSPTKDQA